MESSICSSCQKPKATFTCVSCENQGVHTALCKKCVQFADEDLFSFLPKMPGDLVSGSYCQSCFEQKVAPELESYNQTMAKAHDIGVYFDTQGKETRLIKRLEDPITIENLPDRDETILRLAFKAAQAGFNAIVDVDVRSEKVRMGSYQNLKWRGTCVPAHVDPKKLNR